MGVASGCGCKEVHVYRFPHITYTYSTCICSFWQQDPYFCSLLNFPPVLYDIALACIQVLYPVPTVYITYRTVAV